MQSKKATAKQGRLGTQFRGKLADAYGQRGHNASNLWYGYSPRNDCDVILRSDLEWDHFVLTESDPRIKNVDFAPEPVVAVLSDGTAYSTTLDAVVTYVDEKIEWREIKPAAEFGNNEATRTRRQKESQTIAAENAGVAYTRWSELEIYSNPLKLENWRRVLAWMSAAREYALAPYCTEIAAHLHARPGIRLATLEDLVDELLFPLYVAAAFQGVQKGQFIADLDVKPLSRETTLKLKEVGS
jgi:hypothetical protein